MIAVPLLQMLPTARRTPSARPPFDPASRPAYLLLALAAGAAAVLLPLVGLTLGGQDFGVLAIAAMLLCMAAWCVRGRGWDRIATVVEQWTLLTAASLLAVILSFAIAAATADRPYADDALAAIDRAMVPWFDWPAATRALAARPWVIAPLNVAYASFGWQPTMLILWGAATGRQDRVWRFVAAWPATLLVTMAVFAAVPVLGAYPHFGIGVADRPLIGDATAWTASATVEALRDGTLRTIWLTGLDGIVSLPSFHAAAAVLLAWGFHGSPRLRSPAILLNAAMFVSAVPVGGHYLVDLVAGVAAAVTGIAISGACRRTLAAPSFERAGADGSEGGNDHPDHQRLGRDRQHRAGRGLEHAHGWCSSPDGSGTDANELCCRKAQHCCAHS